MRNFHIWHRFFKKSDYAFYGYLKKCGIFIKITLTFSLIKLKVFNESWPKFHNLFYIILLINTVNFNKLLLIVLEIFTPKKGKKWLKKSILKIFWSLIKPKRYQWQRNEKARNSIIYAIILCKNVFPLFPLCFEIWIFFGEKNVHFFGITNDIYFLKNHQFNKNSSISLNYTILNGEIYVY